MGRKQITVGDVVGGIDVPIWGYDPEVTHESFNSPDGVWETAKSLFVTKGNEYYNDERASIANGLKINPDILAGASPETIDAAKALLDERKRLGSVETLEQVYPEIAGLRYKSAAEAAQVIQNWRDVRVTLDWWDAAKQGIWSANDQQKLGRVAYEYANESDEGKREELKKEIDRLQKNLSEYRIAKTPWNKIVQGTTSTFTQVGSNIAQSGNRAVQGAAMGMTVGALAGATGAGAVTAGIGAPVGAVAGAKAGFVTGAIQGAQIGMAEDIQHVSYGLKYLDLMNKKNARGEQLYSEQEAKNRALMYSVVDAGIEMVALKGVGKAMKFMPASGALGKIVGHEMAETATRGIGRRIGRYAWEGAKGSVKAAVPEILEEGLQDINDKVQTNLFGKEGDDRYSMGDIVRGAGSAMWEAVPAVVGFGALGGLGHIRHRWSVDRKFSRMSATEASLHVEHQKVSAGNTLLTGLMKEADTSKFAKVNPELYGKVIQKVADVRGVSNVYLHVNEALRTEEGMQMLDHLVEKGIVQEQEVKHAVANDVPIEIPIGSFAQTAGIETHAQKALMNVVSYDQEGRSLIGIGETLKDMEKANKGMETSEAYERRVQESKARVLSVPKTQVVRDMVSPIVQDMNRANAEDAVPMMEQAIREYATVMENEYSDLIAEAKELEPQAVRDEWVQSIQKTKKRMPSLEEEIMHASDVIRDNITELPARDIKGQEKVKGFLELGDVLRDAEATKTQLESYVDNYDIHTTLSNEGFKVYEHVAKSLEGTYSRDVAEKEALIFAAHADVYANIMNRAGDMDYTALDYYENIAIEHGGKRTEGYTQPLNADVDLNEKVKVVPLDNLIGELPEGVSLKDYLKGKIGQYTLTADKKAMLGIKNIRQSAHLMYAFGTNQEVHKLSLLNTESLIENAVLVESAPNKKKKPISDLDSPSKRNRIARKNAVKRYHYFYVPVKWQGKVYTVKIVAEETSGNIQVKPQSFALYSVLPLNKKATASSDLPGNNSNLAGYENAVDEISIADMLDGVNGSDGKSYLQMVEDAKARPQGIVTNAENLRKGLVTNEVEELDGDITIFPNGDTVLGKGAYAIVPKDTDRALTRALRDKGMKIVKYDATVEGSKERVLSEAEARATMFQTAWHGTPHQFESFDIGKIGDGTGDSLHGWGLYFAKDKSTAANYRRLLQEATGEKGTLFKVDVPEDNALLNENRPFDSQPKEVKENIAKAIQVLPAEQRAAMTQALIEHARYSPNSKAYDALQKEIADRERVLKNIDSAKDGNAKMIVRRGINRTLEEVGIKTKEDTIDFSNPEELSQYHDKLSAYIETRRGELASLTDKENPITPEQVQADPTIIAGSVPGSQMYNMLSKVLGSDKAASVHLNQHGVHGIRYFDMSDGDCFVIFDDKAIDIITTFNQKQGNVRGLTSFYDKGKRIVQIFDIANASTFIHESGHVFLEDLRTLANMEGAPEQVKKDWQTIKEWTGYDENGTMESNRRAHEKFAQGFEAYVREGKAPSKALERAFHALRKWLVQIYHEVKQLGGNPSKEVTAVMDRMLATEDAMEQYALDKGVGTMLDTDMVGTLGEKEQAVLRDKIAEAKDKVVKELLGEKLEALEGAVQEQWEDVALDTQTKIEEELKDTYPVYKVSLAYAVYGEPALLHSPYQSVEELHEAEMAEGIGKWEEVVERTVAEAKQAFIDAELDPAQIERKVEEYAMKEGVAEEAAIAEAKTITDSVQKIVADLYDEWRLAKSTEGTAEEVADVLLGMKAVPENVKKEVAANPDTAIDAMAKQAKQIQKRITSLQEFKQMSAGTIREYRAQAEQELGELRVSQAISYKTFQNRAVSEGRKCDVCLAEDKLVEAMHHKQRQILYLAKARIAFDNAVQVDKMTKDLKRKYKSITRPKNPTRVNGNARYFFGHLLYQMGLVNRDVMQPTEGFNINDLYRLMDPDVELLAEEDAREPINVIDPKVMKAFDDGANWKRDFTMEEMRDIHTLLTALYTRGKNEYKGTTLVDAKGHEVNYDQAVTELKEQFAKNKSLSESTELPMNIENEKSLTDKANDEVARHLLSITKPETILRRLDSFEDSKGDRTMGAFMRYIYAPIDNATMNAKKMYEEATRTLRQNMSVYSQAELHQIRNKRKYAVGMLRNLTKEQVMCIALNMGTKASRQRVLETCHVDDITMIENDLAGILENKDWDVVESIWVHINSYYEGRSKVQERLYGVPLHKEEGVTFNVGGRVIEGQYYPIVYDAKLDGKTKEHVTEDIAQSAMSTNAVWGLGMGATKNRLAVVKGKSLDLRFDVIPRAIDEAINHIAMREAVTDVNKVINHPAVSKMIADSLGVESLQLMKEWVRDNWQAEIKRTDALDNLMSQVKEASTFAVMALRTSTALLNVLNIIPACAEYGTVRTLVALKRFYGRGYMTNRKFVMERSMFMAERSHNLDAALAEGLSIDGDGLQYNEGSSLAHVSEGVRQAGKVNKFGKRFLYTIITETDYALSLPIWKDAYERQLAKHLEIVENESGKAAKEMMEGGTTRTAPNVEWAEREAVLAADREVRRIFGSGETKDTVRMQRHGQVVSIFTPFYTYCNTVYNALAGGFYESKDTHSVRPFLTKIWAWVILQGAMEALFRSMWDGDDDDLESLCKKAGLSIGTSAVQGFPIIRDLAGYAMARAFGERTFGGNTPLMLSVVDKAEEFINMVGNDKKDWVDMGRTGTQVLNRLGILRLGDTATDGFWTLMRLYESDTDATLTEVLSAIAFDKRLKTREEKRRKERRERNKRRKENRD